MVNEKKKNVFVEFGSNNMSDEIKIISINDNSAKRDDVIDNHNTRRHFKLHVDIADGGEKKDVEEAVIFSRLTEKCGADDAVDAASRMFQRRYRLKRKVVKY